MCWLGSIAFDTRVEASSNYTAAAVTTQFQLSGGAERPDIRVIVDCGRLGTRRTFYVEDKLGASLTNAQRNGYRAVGDAPIVLIDLKQRSDVNQTRFRQTTWAAVAREAWRLGFASASQSHLGWPDYAWTPDAPSEVRMLAEFAAYLEREINVRSQASLSSKDLQILPDAHGVVSRWGGLFELIEQQLGDDPGLRGNTARFGSDGQVGPLGTGWDLRLNPPDGGWAALHARWERNKQEAPTQEDRFSVPSLLLAPSAPWDPTADQVPAVGVGMTVGCTNGWPHGLREDDDLYKAAREHGFTLGITGGDRGRIFRTRALVDLTEYPTLQAQAEEIVQWARQVLEEFKALGQ